MAESAAAQALSDFDAGENSPGERATPLLVEHGKPPSAAAQPAAEPPSSSLLADALADFDADESVHSSQEPLPARESGIPGPSAPGVGHGGGDAQQRIEQEADELARQLLQSLNPADTSDSGGMEETLASLARSAEGLTSQSNGDEVALTELFKQLGAGGPSDGLGPDSGGGDQSGGGDDNKALDGLLDNLVGQLLSKDVMLEPMQHLHAEFPRYLAAHAGSLSASDLQRYRRQQEIVRQILAAYEGSGNTDRVAQLMQEMQQCGPPPAELAGATPDCVLS